MKNTISDINALPAINKLIHFCKALALLDSILMPDWEYRYFSFNCFWNEEENEMMASMRDGSGGEYFILFTDHGVVGKVFDQVPLVDPVRVLNSIPTCFKNFVSEPAFNLKKISYCFWRKKNDMQWVANPTNLQEFSLLEFLVEGISYYHEWAEEYYEQKIDFQALSDVFDTLKVTNDLLLILNSDITLNDLDEDLEEILGETRD